MVDIIHSYQSSSLSGSHLTAEYEEKLSYLCLLKETTRPGVLEKMFDDLGKLISRQWALNSNIRADSSQGKVSLRKTLMQWVSLSVHGGTINNQKLSDLAMATQEEIYLPSGRRVVITRNNLEYQLAMVFADETLMVPENFIFLDKTYPLFLPDFKNSSPLVELNTSLFHERTTHTLKEYKAYKNENCSHVIPNNGSLPRV
eukprot:14336572-Ditylum_brightwellii.AAC.1